MAGTLVGAVGSPLLLRSLSNRHRFLLRRQRRSLKPLFSSGTRAITSESAEVDPSAAVHGRTDFLSGIGSLACPICYAPLITSGSVVSKGASGLSGLSLECSTCRKAYACKEAYVDLTVCDGSNEYTEAMPASTELFRNSLVAFLYERGWRQNFVLGGFPGPEKEFEMAKEYLKPTVGGTVVDASCGSGMFSRLFANSKLYSLVVALDFSENMLRQCDDFISQEGISREADVSRLPFVSRSVDAVHAGAALHCWPSPSAAVAEISRILRPGGVFVATTFIIDGVVSLLPFVKALRPYYTSSTGQHLYFSEGELADLCRTCGLGDFTCVRNGSFVMLSATKLG